MNQKQLKLKIKELINNNKMFNSIIISSNNHEETSLISNDIARMFFCENTNTEQDGCLSCKHFKSQNILDLISVGDGNLPITKTEIQTIISQFSLTAREKFNRKVYIINTAENLKLDAANSLLKFLEEPPKNTFAILLTKNKSEILPTIRSRCSFMVFENLNNKINEENPLLSMLSLSKEEILLSNIKIKKFEKSELIKLCEEAYQIIKSKSSLNIKLLEIWIQFVDDLKFNVSKNLSIDNWLIRIAEVI